MIIKGIDIYENDFFNEEYRYKIKLLAKLECEIHKDDKTKSTSIYLLEAHDNKYVLTEEFSSNEHTLNLINVNDFSYTVKKAEKEYELVWYFTPENKYLENKVINGDIFYFKDMIINNDISDNSFGIKNHMKFNEISSIDLLVLLNTSIEKTTDYVNRFLRNIPTDGYRPRPQFVLKDGTKLSIQASEYTYCLPRINNASKYEKVEVGFPTKVFPELLEYAEEPESPLNSVYPYVPVDVLNDIIDREKIEPCFYNKYLKDENILEK